MSIESCERKREYGPKLRIPILYSSAVLIAIWNACDVKLDVLDVVVPHGPRPQMSMNLP
jgi:hypothetical protein